MNVIDILSRCDHTLLSPDATERDIIGLCDEGLKYTYLGDRLPICTVIGFPNGYSTTSTKVAEAKDAIGNGASEIDMVVNIGLVKSSRYDEVRDEIMALRRATEGYVLKVIIETSLLSDEEKVIMCKIVSDSGADYIKTSTGFNGGGATVHDVKLLVDNVSAATKVKASGGIKTLKDAENFITLGADRLGTSRIVKIVSQMTQEIHSILDVEY